MLPSGLLEQVEDGEDLARFLVHRSQFNTTSVKPSAFLPNPKDSETSVSRHARQPVERLWELGLLAAGRRHLYAAAFVTATDVRAAGLDVVADEPPDRHAVIRGWPWNESDPELQKGQQKELALILASVAGPPLLRNL